MTESMLKVVQSFYKCLPIEKQTAANDMGAACINPWPYHPKYWQPWRLCLLKTLWEKEKMMVAIIFSFSHNVFCLAGDKNPHLSYFCFFVCKCLQWMVDSEILSFGEDLTCVKVKGMSICEGFWLTLSQTSPCFYVSAVQILKTLWKKEKLLVVNNFSFTHSVFLHIWRTLSFFFKFEIVVCKLFQFGRVQNLSFGKQLKQKLLETSWALDSGE